MICRAVAPEELERTLFAGFVRRQEVNLCYRREHGRWVVRADPFIDDWSEDDYRFLLECLHNTLQTGGALFGVFDGGTLKGFASVESRPMGTRGQYRDCPPCTSPPNAVGAGWAASCSRRPPAGRARRAPRSSTFRRIPRWKRSGSTARSAARTPSSRTPRIPRASRSTASSNTGCKGERLP